MKYDVVSDLIFFENEQQISSKDNVYFVCLFSKYWVSKSVYIESTKPFIPWADTCIGNAEEDEEPH